MQNKLLAWLFRFSVLHSDKTVNTRLMTLFCTLIFFIAIYVYALSASHTFSNYFCLLYMYYAVSASHTFYNYFCLLYMYMLC